MLSTVVPAFVVAGRGEVTPKSVTRPVTSLAKTGGAVANWYEV